MREPFLAGLLSLAIAAPAAAQDAGVVDNHLNARGRAADQLSNPDYQARTAPLGVAAVTGQDTSLGWMTDPYRLGWTCPGNGCRGRGGDVFFKNRYGARLHGRLFAPKSGDGPFPAIVFGTGNRTPERPYWSLAQGIAEAGYVVMTVESQGEGLSEKEPPDPDPATPENEYCRPGNWGGWQHRVDLGIREEGPCAGVDAPAMLVEGSGVEDPTEGPVAAAPILAVDVVTEQTDWDAVARGFRRFRARETYAIADALTFLLSPRNPLRDLVDERRAGTVGHSGGGHGALWAGNADPRFDVAIAFDQHGHLEGGVGPRVPTMFQVADQEEAGPKRGGRAYDSLPAVKDLAHFRRAGVDAMLVTLGGSTHQEWNYVPYLMASAVSPGCVVFCSSSSRGERVALHYALAWLDRWLKPSKKKSATRRLLARRFDGSADASSIGQGTFDPATQRNVPYRIQGRAVSDHLSRYFRSAAAFGDVDCGDLRAGC